MSRTAACHTSLESGRPVSDTLLDRRARPIPETLPNNLTAPPTRLIGREWEVRAACEQLLQEHIRLLTLTGPGGSGKTHLALAVGDELLGAFPDGVWLVDLTSLHESSLVLAIARVLGLQKARSTVGFRAAGGGSARSTAPVGAGQLRARPRGGVTPRGAAERLPQAEGAGHKPRAVTAALGA